MASCRTVAHIMLSFKDFFKIGTHQLLYNLLMKWLVKDSRRIRLHFGCYSDPESHDEIISRFLRGRSLGYSEVLIGADPNVLLTKAGNLSVERTGYWDKKVVKADAYVVACDVPRN
ncbi:hypothetical protein OIU85_010202 [Salix viminalis]|uniref:Uncharacterized protein n=1 Tax=Salix viminalis TaxID=40686 RepID=A0A9Q0NWC5_SALVM|nr:hypothetical protein OIU85_010202 [Salix viminalis]